MNARRIAALLVAACGAAACGAGDFLDEVDDALTVDALHDSLRARLSGSIELEGYEFQQPAPALINADGDSLFNPRLVLFLDAQLGSHLYFFAQGRVDRGFDPSDDSLRGELDEYALRYTPWDDARFNLQVGKFATTVGNWVPRHGSWENPFVNAPLPYENLTGIWDIEPAPSAGALLQWSHVRPGLPAAIVAVEKYRRVPVIWGPSYATGAAVAGVLGRYRYAVEIKDASLSSPPEAWNDSGRAWRHPTFSGRLGYEPNEMWTFGFSVSTGPYLLPSAAATIPARHDRGEYRETVIGQDVGFAWHHLQVWTELYEVRFAVPAIGPADTFAYYTEVKYKFTPQFFGAVRWNQQLFATIPTSAGNMPWGRDVWRADFAPGYRFTAHTQLKLEFSLQHETGAPRYYDRTIATQYMLRF
jgi:hypothetical protein